MNRATREGRVRNSKDTGQMLQRMITEKLTASGTAIYVRYDDKEYLISAKHVLADPTILNYLSQNISIKTPLDYYLGGRINNFVISNTGKLTSVIVDSLDLCIISLQGEPAQGIRAVLKQDGYEPVALTEKDLALEIKTGNDIIAIGYPEISAIEKMKRWNTLQASDIVVPVTTFGKVSMFHQKLPFFMET